MNSVIFFPPHPDADPEAVIREMETILQQLEEIESK